MENKEIINALENNDIVATPVRQLIYKCIEESDYPLSLTDIEKRLETVDKSSISRTLNLFKKTKIVHYFDDGSGSVKYEICHDHENGKHQDSHIHFHCLKCGETICLSEIKIPEILLPEGFKTESVNYIVSGLCNNCNSH